MAIGSDIELDVEVDTHSIDVTDSHPGIVVEVDRPKIEVIANSL